MKNFDASFFGANRQELRRRIANNDPIIVTANGLVQRAGDSGFPFRQDSNFWYLTGIQLADAILVITEKSEFIILPDRSPAQDYFEGAINVADLSKISGIEAVLSNHEGWEKLTLITKRHKNLNTCMYKGYDQRHAIYINPSKPRLISRLRKISPSAMLSDLRPSLTHMRMIKQPAEITAIRNSIDVTVKSFKQVFKGDWYKDNKLEATINARFSYEFIKAGGVPAYPSIVAGGVRACTLHYEHNNQPLDKNELLLVDAGAEVGMYASDITRVYAPKKMTSQQEMVYRAVKDIQDYAIGLLKPGVSIRDIDEKVEKKIGQFLKAQKLITKQDPTQIRKYYPHVISHHLGLDVHDVADYSKGLESGNVITVEPGIYIPEWSVGVRLEDDILITDKGAENLSVDLPS